MPENGAPLTDDQALDIGMTHLRSQAEAGYPWAAAVVAEVERLRTDLANANSRIRVFQAESQQRRIEVERLRQAVESHRRATLRGTEPWDGARAYDETLWSVLDA